MPMTSIFQLRYSSLSARVENCGPSMQRYVPPACTVAPAAKHAARKCWWSVGQTGSQKATWTTIPSPKKVRGRATVRSMYCAGSTRWPGAISSFIEPTALTEMTRVTPNCLSACRLARAFTSVGVRRWPIPWRGRKAISSSPRRPTTIGSLGSPKGVDNFSRRTPVRPGRSYRPDPPMTPRTPLDTARGFRTARRSGQCCPTNRAPSGSEEPGHEGRGRRFTQLRQRALLGDAARLEHDDAIAHRGVGRIVPDHQRRDGHGGEARAEKLAHLHPRDRIERGERLVEEQRVGLGRERPGHRDALALTAGERSGGPAGQMRDLERLEDRQRALAPARAGEPESHIVEHRQVRKERRVLRHVTEAPSLGREVDPGGGIEQYPAAHRDAPGGGAQEVQDLPQHAGLARSIGTRQHERTFGQREARQDLHLAGAAAEGEIQGAPTRSARAVPERTTRSRAKAAVTSTTDIACAARASPSIAV